MELFKWKCGCFEDIESRAHERDAASTTTTSEVGLYEEVVNFNGDAKQPALKLQHHDIKRITQV